MKAIISAVATEVLTVLSNVDEKEAANLAKELKNAKRIFVHGEGRSGLMGKAFAMRLMHGGFPVYVTGETITPSIEADDLFIAISGSGSTGSILQLGETAKKIGARLFAVTTERESELARKSDSVLVIPAATKHRRPSEPNTIQPLGNQFDQAVHLILDAVIIYALRTEEQDADYRNLARRHTNLE